MEKPPRLKIFVRFMFTMLFMMILEIIRVVIQLFVVFQYIYMFITGSPNESVRNFMSRLAAYQYSVTRYIGVLDNSKPFPLGELTTRVDAPEETVSFE